MRLAVDEGFKHAMTAIIDSNVSTVLTASFLFQFGTGPVKGFAVTLIIGIFASLVTAVFVTRTFYMLWLKRRPDMDDAESLGMLRLFARRQIRLHRRPEESLRGHRRRCSPSGSCS